MKVVCEYCGSYVEADENLKCPLCGGNLGSAVQTEQARIEAQEELGYQRETAEAAEEAKNEHISQIINGVAGAVTAYAAGKGVAGAFATNESENEPPASPEGFRRPPDGHPAPPHLRTHTDDTKEQPSFFDVLTKKANSATEQYRDERDSSFTHERPRHDAHDNPQRAAFRRDQQGEGRPSGGRPNGRPGEHPGSHSGEHHHR